MSMTLKKNPLLKLEELGQSIWLDYTRRDLIAGGELRRLIEEDGLRGMTSNPSIFEKAITGSASYDDDIGAMAFEGQSPNAIYEALSQRDVQAAADEFRAVYDKTNGGDGYVSLEVNPHLAHDRRGTIVEARRLWRALKRPNVFIKVPATAEGIPAIRELISDGINVNVTLLFGLGRYRQVAAAYLAGIEERVAKRQAVKHVASVASFFVSRIDSLVDPQLERLIMAGGVEADLARAAHGEVAVANAKMAYRIYKEIFVYPETVAGKRFRELAELGARAQRLLWASTSTKNPDYNDLKYVEALIGPNTINTVPTETLRAYRAAGEPKARLEEGMEQASRILDSLPELGINLDQVTEQLEAEGVDKFNQAFDKLITALKEESHRPEKQTATSAS
jgi:transaldolase